ncbi:peroxiredoxin-like family protein [Fulvivirgaceae bacterium BMA10]|uniref:thioredoxin-dependent peroxiredoxin n=1 Tax=Splendidivirga corallicola TaxID=3051826 RepID=A0ABT8L0V0_9BACT|nr:peroxiredoxin-like family protein [Fulvivirgaceae bacterium BMA10]
MLKKTLLGLLIFVVILVTTAFFYFSAGEEVYPEGLEVGNNAPTFTAMDQHGQLMNLESLREKGPVVMIFYRGFWCPSCQKHLSMLQDSLHLVMEKGASVLAITPQKSEYTAQHVEKNSSSISIIHDQGHKIMNQYDVAYQMSKGSARLFNVLGTDLAQQNGDNTNTLPVPAVFIIGQDGRIKYASKKFGGLVPEYITVKEILANL